jgi:hypothetical protein
LLAFARFFFAMSFKASIARLSKVSAVADSAPQSLRATAIDLDQDKFTNQCAMKELQAKAKEYML